MALFNPKYLSKAPGGHKKSDMTEQLSTHSVNTIILVVRVSAQMQWHDSIHNSNERPLFLSK